MDRWLAAALFMSLGTTKGWTLFLPSSYTERKLSSQVFIPPAAVPSTTPVDSDNSSVISKPDCPMASRLAMSVSCVTRSYNANFCRSKYISGSKSLICAPILTDNLSRSRMCKGPIPSRPSRMACNVSGTVAPKALIVPAPVITTRFMG